MPQTGTSSGRSRSSSRSRPDNEANPDMSLAGIGNYVFEKTIGQGNFAKVKLAKHKLTNREVAIKIIDKTTLDEKKLSKLHREVRIMKMLNHPNIVKLFEVIETKYTLFLVMEYVAGGELYDYLVAHGRMKEKDARAKFRQILSAVNYCHKKRVIHRDLKAENLLLDENLNIKIADFGFSNNYAPEGQLDTFCGSPPYAAPELFQGRKYTGPEVDVWSLGVILYVLCTGCLPFDGKDLKEMREVVCRGRYKVPFYLSEPCEKLLRKFLVRDPTKRASLDIIKDDPWLNDGYPEPVISDAIQPDAIQRPDDEVINFMVDKFNVTKDQVLTCLAENLYDDISAIYFLIVDQKQAGKWTSGQLLTPLLTTGSSFVNPPSPLSKPIPMGTIGENAPLQVQTPPLSSSANNGRTDPIVHRERSNTYTGTGTGGRQRPVTWYANDSSNQPSTKPEESVVDTNSPSPAANIPTINAPNSQTTKGAAGGVFGMLRSFSQKVVDNPNQNQQAQQDATQANNGDRPRALRFTFNSNTTSSKPAHEIVNEIIRVCQKLNIKLKQNGKYLIECQWNPNQNPSNAGGGTMNVEQLQKALAEVMNTSETSLPQPPSRRVTMPEEEPSATDEIVMFDIEVCELPRLRNLHGLRFRRAAGSSGDYKDICSKILASLNL